MLFSKGRDLRSTLWRYSLCFSSPMIYGQRCEDILCASPRQWFMVNVVKIFFVLLLPNDLRSTLWRYFLCFSSPMIYGQRCEDILCASPQWFYGQRCEDILCASPPPMIFSWLSMFHFEGLWVMIFTSLNLTSAFPDLRALQTGWESEVLNVSPESHSLLTILSYYCAYYCWESYW